MGHFVDMIASVAVDKATDIIHGYIEQKMTENGLFVTNRFSPDIVVGRFPNNNCYFRFFLRVAVVWS